MNTGELLAALHARGVSLFLDGDRLRFRAPAGALVPELRAAIAEQRLAIIDRLRPTPVAVSSPNAKCTWCDPRDWVDAPSVAGRIRTICGKCGRFIGYRPVGT